MVKESPYSERTLKRYFYEQLPRCPVWHIQRREKVNLLIDGTYFPNKVCLVLYRDTNIRMTPFYRLTDGERLHELREDLQNIKNTGIEIESVTCDGAANILKAVREVCPEAVLQRCTVHIAREIELWLTRKPKSEAGRELLELVRLLGRVETKEEAQLWTRAFSTGIADTKHLSTRKRSMNRPDTGGTRTRCYDGVPRISEGHCRRCLHIHTMIKSLNLRTQLKHFSDISKTIFAYIADSRKNTSRIL